jgi:hypothetical protein
MATLGARMPTLDPRATGVSPDWHRKPAAHWLAQVEKAAALGGDPDSGFETSFANLAHTLVRDKAPQLLRYEVGFQLVDKDQDGTKVLGVFAFKVGESWLYVPIFFLNGRLKGHELLYLKNQDLFVPLKEAWINYLTGRDPDLIGRPVDRSLARRLQSTPQLPDFSGRFKGAAEDPPWLRDFYPVLAKMAYSDIFGELQCLKAAAAIGPKAVGFFRGIRDSHPSVGRTLEGVYGDGFVEKLAAQVAEARSVLKRAHVVDMDGAAYENPFKPKAGDGDPLKANHKPQVILRKDHAFPKGLNGIEAEEMFRTGKVVRDSRENSAVSVAYEANVSGQLYNPPESGLYDVLVKPTSFKRLAVFLHPRDERGHKRCCLVFDPDKPTKYALVDVRRVWAKGEAKPADFKKWFDGLENASSLPEPGENPWRGAQTVLLGPDGQATTPVQVRAAYGDDAYRVSFESYYESYDSDRPASAFRGETGRSEKPINSVRLGVRGSRFRQVGDELVVPAGFKKVTVRKARGDGDDTSLMSTGEKADDGPLEPGCLADLKMWLSGTLRPLSVKDDGDGFEMNGKTIDKPAALKHLVEDWGLRAGAVEAIFAKAAARPRLRHEYFVKLATPYLTEQGPTSPAFPDAMPMQSGGGILGRQVPEDPSFQGRLPIPEMGEQPGARDAYQEGLNPPDPGLLGSVQQAAQTGQREVIDTAMFSGMLRAVGDETVVDQYLGDLTKGMDRLGRIYFQMLWHGEKFEKRYGRQDMPALEDSVRNGFESVGDVILTLRRKNPEDVDTFGIDVDLEDAAQ